MTELQKLIIEKQIELIGKLQLNNFYPAEEISNILSYYDGVSINNTENYHMRYSDFRGNFYIFLGNKKLKYLGTWGAKDD